MTENGGGGDQAPPDNSDSSDNPISTDTITKIVTETAAAAVQTTTGDNGQGNSVDARSFAFTTEALLGFGCGAVVLLSMVVTFAVFVYRRRAKRAKRSPAHYEHPDFSGEVMTMHATTQRLDDFSTFNATGMAATAMTSTAMTAAAGRTFSGRTVTGKTTVQGLGNTTMSALIGTSTVMPKQRGTFQSGGILI